LVFDHGSYRDYGFDGSGSDDDHDASLPEANRGIEDIMRPMDVRLLEHILPVLGYSNWGVLQRQEINGVGGAEPPSKQRLIDQVVELAQDKLRVQLSPSVDLKWEQLLWDPLYQLSSDFSMQKCVYIVKPQLHRSEAEPI